MVIENFTKHHAWRSAPQCPLFPYRMGGKVKEGSELIKGLEKVLKITKREDTLTKK